MAGRTLNKTAVDFNRFSVERDASGDITVIVNYSVDTVEKERIFRSERFVTRGTFKTRLEDDFATVETELNTKEGL